MSRRDYETPKIPEDTPPVIAEKVGEEAEASETNRALDRELTRRDKRDGAGEAALDRMPPD